MRRYLYACVEPRFHFNKLSPKKQTWPPSRPGILKGYLRNHVSTFYVLSVPGVVASHPQNCDVVQISFSQDDLIHPSFDILSLQLHTPLLLIFPIPRQKHCPICTPHGLYANIIVEAPAGDPDLLKVSKLRVSFGGHAKVQKKEKEGGPVLRVDWDHHIWKIGRGKQDPPQRFRAQTHEHQKRR